MIIVEPRATVIDSEDYLRQQVCRMGFAARASRGNALWPNIAQAEDLLLRLARLGHWSVFEHSLITVEIVCSRAISHELVRHRHTAITQESTRYVDEQVKVVLPPDHDEASVEAVRQALADYRKARKRGIPRESARYLLPHSLATRLIMSASVREWRHIVELRASKKAAPEIRLLAHQIQRQLLEVSPALMPRVKP